jgi:hypothetical protein
MILEKKNNGKTLLEGTYAVGFDSEYYSIGGRIINFKTSKT